MRYILVSKHKGKKKNYYSVHLMEDDMYLRIFGRFSKFNKAEKRANELAVKYNCLVRFSG